MDATMSSREDHAEETTKIIEDTSEEVKVIKVKTEKIKIKEEKLEHTILPLLDQAYFNNDIQTAVKVIKVEALVHEQNSLCEKSELIDIQNISFTQDQLGIVNEEADISLLSKTISPEQTPEVTCTAVENKDCQHVLQRDDHNKRSNIVRSVGNIIYKEGDKSLMCDQCPYHTSLKCNLKAHQLRHSWQKPYSCATRKDHLKHNLLQHTGEKPYSCGKCSFSTIMSSELKIHQYKHSGEKPFMCDKCPYRTTCKTNLKQHQYKHSGKKPFMCGQCPYHTTWKTKLMLHQYKHWEEKSFMCDKCPYRTSVKRNLKEHKLQHSQKKPGYSCDKYFFSTTSSSALKIHHYKHTGLFQCHKCQFSSIKESVFIRHQTNHPDYE